MTPAVPARGRWRRGAQCCLPENQMRWGANHAANAEITPGHTKCESPLQVIRTVTGLLLVMALMLLASCGNGDDEAETPTPALSVVTPTSQPPAASPAPPPSVQPLLPCFVDLDAASRAALAPSPTPEVIRIQLLDRPYRMVPSDIVLKLNRTYRFIVSTESNWQAFRIKDMPPGIYFEIPPSGQLEFDLHTTRAGVFIVENWRRIQESRFFNSITVVPEGTSIATWQPQSCGFLSVQAPALGANLTTPFVIQGRFAEPYGSALHVDRLEAWNDGELVGVAKSEDFLNRGSQTSFDLTVRSLPPGSHTVLLKVLLQNGAIIAHAEVPVTILVDPK